MEDNNTKSIGDSLVSGTKRKGSLVWAALVFGLCLIISVGVFSYTNYYLKITEKATISVSGSIKQAVKSDTVKWTIVFSKTAPINDLKLGYANIKTDRDAVIDFLKKAGIEESSMTVAPVNSMPIQLYSNTGPITPTENIFTQNIYVNSNDVEKIKELARNIDPLINQNVRVDSSYLEYYYSKLPETRVELLGQAVQDAQKRAQKIVEGTGRHLGNLQSAAAGVVQVLPLNSVDVSDYGSYDTSSINKEVMVTVKTVFNIK